ncbi:MAG: hypothetical protein E7564_02475 [Ruminococcaceae bacterium]|nr:hypothetical protein [Oscillospiraceae bacterium]
MNNLGFALGKIKVKISFWFLFVICAVSLISENFNSVLIAVIIHELSHVATLYFMGGKIEEINLRLTDINISTNVLKLPVLKAVSVILAGPMANLLLGIMFKNYNKEFSFVNFSLGLFQILPVFSSDLDNLLKVLFKGKFFKLFKVIYFIFALLIFFLGINLIIVSKYNFTLLVMGIFLIIKTLL